MLRAARLRRDWLSEEENGPEFPCPNSGATGAYTSGPPHFTLRGGGRPQSLRPAPGALALWGKVARVTATCQELTKVCPMRGRQTGRHED